MITFQQQKHIQPIRKAIDKYQYNTNDIIGRGFSSIVYKGINEITGDVVSIKVVESRGLKEEVQRMILQNEIDTLKKLNGDNTLRLHDCYQTLNNTYIITDYCEQGDLGTFIRLKVCLSEEEATAILSHIMNGLTELEKHGIAHRDLKPENILLKQNIPKIADFGFAKELNQIQSNGNFEFNVGTPLYMSPETLTRNQYSNKTDIWALGVMFFEMLYGKGKFQPNLLGHVPWKVNTEKELIHCVYNVPVQFPQSPSISSTAQEIIRLSLAVDSNQRLNLSQLRTLLKKKIEHTSQIRQVSPKPQRDQQPVAQKDTQRHTKTLNPPDQQTETESTNYSKNSSKLQENKPVEYKHNIHKYNNDKNFDFSNGAIWVIKCEEIIQSQLDLCIFLIKLLDQINEQYQDNLNIAMVKLKFLISKNIMIVISKLYDQMEDQKSNPLKLQYWQDFVKLQVYMRLKIVIFGLQDKYNRIFDQFFSELLKNDKFIDDLSYDQDVDALFDQNLIQFPSFYMVLQPFLQKTIREINHNLIMHFKPDQYTNTLKTINKKVDLNLLSYYKVVSMLRKNLFDPYSFAEESKGNLQTLEYKSMTLESFIQLRQRIKGAVN